MAPKLPPQGGWPIDALSPDQIDIETIDAFHLGGAQFSASFELSDEHSEFARSFLLNVRYDRSLEFDIRLRIENSIKSHSSLAQDRHLVLELGGIIHELLPEGDRQVTLPEGLLRKIWSRDALHHYVFGNRGICYFREGGDWQLIQRYADTYIKGVHGPSATEIYACGSEGELLLLNGQQWIRQELPLQAHFSAIHVSKDQTIHLAGFEGQCYALRDMELIPLQNEGFSYMGIAEFKGQRYWSDANFGLSIQRGDRIEPFRALGQGFSMHSSADYLVISGWKEVFIFDGENWKGFELGYDGNLFLSALDMTQYGG